MIAPYWSDASVTLHLGDCIEVLAGMDAASVDAVVTDPPYGLEFMGKEWDGADGFRRSLNPADAERDSVFGRTSRTGPEYSTGRGSRVRTERAAEMTPRGEGHSTSAGPYLATGVDSVRVAGPLYQQWCTAWARECLRVLKPGGHLLAFGGTRTYHRLACAVEDAGFEIRDSMHWIYGAGFPKSLDVSKAIDKAAGAERAVVGRTRAGISGTPGRGREFENAAEWLKRVDITAPATDDAARWEGWGTALKPAHEPIVVARKPLAGTVAQNVLEHGTGALNIDGCRVEHANGADLATSQAKNPGRADTVTSGVYGAGRPQQSVNDAGRWPANILLTHSPDCEPVGTRTVRSDGHHPAARGSGGLSTSGHSGQEGLTERKAGPETVQVWDCAPDCPVAELDRQSGVLTSGKPGVFGRSGSDREGNTSAAYGAESRPAGTPMVGFGDSGGASRFFPVFKYEAKANASERPRGDDGTAHPTVKPVDLMAWLVRLVTPPGGTVLDCFAGSGTTAEACIVEGFCSVLIEKDPAYCELIRKRLSKPIQPSMFGGEVA